MRGLIAGAGTAGSVSILAAPMWRAIHQSPGGAGMADVAIGKQRRLIARRRRRGLGVEENGPEGERFEEVMA